MRSVWRVLFPFSLVLAQQLFSEAEAADWPRLVRYELRQTLQLGQGGNVASEGILVQPKCVARDRRGYVWVSDEALGVIKKFDRDGECVAIIGGRGHGPAEFAHITAMTVNWDNELVVVDYLNAKVARFSSDGTFLGSARWPSKIATWPRRIIACGDSSYLVLAKSPGNDYVIHRFDARLRYDRSFGRVPILYRQHEDLERWFAEVKPGEVLASSDGLVYYAPGLYGGTIYMYRDGRLVGTLRSSRKAPRVYECEYLSQLRPGPPPPKYDMVMARAGGGMYYVRTNVRSGGMNLLGDGTLAHLVIVRHGQGHEIGVEVFPPDGSPASYQVLAGEEMPWTVWQASGGRWYLIDPTADPPCVREFVLVRTDE